MDEVIIVGLDSSFSCPRFPPLSSRTVCVTVTAISRQYIVLIACLFFIPEVQTYSMLQKKMLYAHISTLITLVNTQNVSVNKIVDSSSIQRAETKYGLRIQFLALVFTIHEVWLNA